MSIPGNYGTQICGGGSKKGEKHIPHPHPHNKTAGFPPQRGGPRRGPGGRDDKGGEGVVASALQARAKRNALQEAALYEGGTSAEAPDDRFPKVCDDRPSDNAMSVNAKAWLNLFVVTFVMGLLLFVLAGTIHYWQAWVYIGIYVTASFLIVLYLMKRDPELLGRRMRGGPTAEKRKPQRAAMVLASLAFIASMAVPALDHRFGWSRVPIYSVILGEVLTSLWYLAMFRVLRENTFSAATVQITEGQKVISTGPYAIVRHPMYAGGLLSFIGAPLALGSWWGLFALLIALPALIWRLVDEEKLLRSSLPGYTEYAERVRYRLIPGVF